MRRPFLAAVATRTPRYRLVRLARAIAGLMVRVVWRRAALLVTLVAIGSLLMMVFATLSSARAGRRASMPLRITSASLKGSASDTISGSVRIRNEARRRVPATRGAVRWRRNGSRAMASLSTFAVPVLSAGKHLRLRLHATRPRGARAGRYQLFVCVDVHGRLARFRPKRNCRKAGGLSVRASSVVTLQLSAAALSIESAI